MFRRKIHVFDDLIYEGEDSVSYFYGDKITDLYKNGFDLVAAESKEGALRVTFSRRLPGEEEQRFHHFTIQKILFEDVSHETFLAIEAYGCELRAATVIDELYMRYYFRCPLPHKDAHWMQRPKLDFWWEHKIVERPIMTVEALKDSLASLEADGWLYRDHEPVRRTDGPIFLVFLQRKTTDPSLDPWQIRDNEYPL